MKKLSLAALAVATMVALPSQAATVLGFKVGVDAMHADASGITGQQGGDTPKFSYDNKAQYSLWFNVEHPLPLLPNLKVRENRFEANGILTDANFNFRGINLTDVVHNKIDLTNTDFMLYYELFDNDILSIDAGAAYKKFNGSLEISRDSYRDTIDIDDGVVMGYLNAEVGLIGTGLYGFAEVLAGVDHSDILDYQAGLGWQFDGVAIDTRVRVGYRKLQFQDNSFSGVKANVDIDGVFAGVELVF
ncbi:TIGR04219 family outer membrane beta-barrel protein [Shewanella sp.]|uniref:TIGR04219 family outer membrane beta-barrel protein n=1 Tax=Shewanella sp. TaxID=50422 RepID=UPI003A96B861